MTTTAAAISLRGWRGFDDLVGMAAANQRLRTRVRLLEPIGVEEMRHHYEHLVNSELATDVRIVERDGETVGYIRVEWHNLEDGDRGFGLTVALDPSTWGTGAMDRALDWAEARCASIAATLPADRVTWLEDWVFEGDDEHIRALEARGYARVRWGGQMLRPDLEAIVDMPVSAGYAIRSPEAHELPAVFEAAKAGFADEWGQVASDDWSYEEWVEDPRFRRDLVVVAWQGDVPVSVVHNLLTLQPDGEIRALVDGVSTLPAHRRRGLARACVAESLRRIKVAGATSAYLGVDQDSENRTVALYEACGFRLVSETSSWRKRLALTVAK